MTVREVLIIQKDVLEILNKQTSLSSHGGRLELESEIRKYFENYMIKLVEE